MTLNELMNVPYHDHGRDSQGLDCWGFVRLVRHYHHNLPMLPSFGFVSPDDKSGMTKTYEQVITEFCQTEPIDGAIGCHFIGDRLVHVGVVINEHGLLKVAHTGRKMRRACLARLADFERLALVTKYYIENDYVSGLPEQA